jgi:putative SOS response-associated peptidase YedK
MGSWIAYCLWDYWENDTKEFGFYSFALITDEPPKEVADAGHDRCPIFLEESKIGYWLNTQGKIPTDFYEILAKKEIVYYVNQWVS